MQMGHAHVDFSSITGGGWLHFSSKNRQTRAGHIGTHFGALLEGIHSEKNESNSETPSSVSHSEFTQLDTGKHLHVILYSETPSVPKNRQTRAQHIVLTRNSLSSTPSKNESNRCSEMFPGLRGLVSASLPRPQVRMVPNHLPSVGDSSELCVFCKFSISLIQDMLPEDDTREEII
jgi:hypothetical protein